MVLLQKLGLIARHLQIMPQFGTFYAVEDSKLGISLYHIWYNVVSYMIDGSIKY